MKCTHYQISVFQYSTFIESMKCVRKGIRNHQFPNYSLKRERKKKKDQKYYLVIVLLILSPS